jgi:hypothetical protein
MNPYISQVGCDGFHGGRSTCAAVVSYCSVKKVTVQIGTDTKGRRVGNES